MSENLNPFDNHFRQRLTDAESSVPDDLFDRLQARRGAALPSDAPLRERLSAHETLVSDAIFDAVLAERARQKRRRVVLWRSATAIAAALLLLFVAIEFKNKNTISIDKSVELSGVNAAKNEANNAGLNTDKTVDNNVNNSELNTHKTVENNTDAIDLNNNKIIENSKNTEGYEKELKIKNSELNTSNSVSNDVKKQQVIIAKTADFNKNKNANSNQKITKTQSNNPIASVVSDKLGNKNTKNDLNTEGSNYKLKIQNSKLNNVNSNVNNISNNELNSVNSIGNNVINSELNTAKTIENSLNTEGSNFELINKNKALKTVLENRLSSPNFQTPTLDFLHILSVKTVALPTENRKNPCSDPGNGCPTFIGRRRMNHIGYYIDAFVAPEYMMRSFSTNLPESEKLLAARDSNEKVQYAVSTGVRGSVVFGNGISLRAGLVFNQMNERVQFDSFGIGSIKTTYDVRIVNGKPDTVSITTVITDGIFRKTRYNQYRSIDIPLQIGYNKRMKNGWTVGVNGGANVNITAWRKADIFGTNLQKQTVSSDINEANPVFRNQLGISLIGSVAVYRQLTNGLELMIEPSVRYGLQPITRSDYALKQQYSTAGLIVGLRLRF